MNCHLDANCMQFIYKKKTASGVRNFTGFESGICHNNPGALLHIRGENFNIKARQMAQLFSFEGLRYGRTCTCWCMLCRPGSTPSCCSPTPCWYSTPSAAYSAASVPPVRWGGVLDFVIQSYNHNFLIKNIKF